MQKQNTMMYYYQIRDEVASLMSVFNDASEELTNMFTVRVNGHGALNAGLKDISDPSRQAHPLTKSCLDEIEDVVEKCLAESALIQALRPGADFRHTVKDIFEYYVRSWIFQASANDDGDYLVEENGWFTPCFDLEKNWMLSCRRENDYERVLFDHHMILHTMRSVSYALFLDHTYKLPGREIYSFECPVDPCLIGSRRMIWLLFNTEFRKPLTVTWEGATQTSEKRKIQQSLGRFTNSAQDQLRVLVRSQYLIEQAFLRSSESKKLYRIPIRELTTKEVIDCLLHDRWLLDGFRSVLNFTDVNEIFSHIMRLAADFDGPHPFVSNGEAPYGACKGMGTPNWYNLRT